MEVPTYLYIVARGMLWTVDKLNDDGSPKEGYVRERADEDVSSGTRRNYCRSIKRCLRWAKQQGYIDSNPIADMEMPKGGKREKVVSDAEWSTILNCVSDRAFRDLLFVTGETGCRPQE